MGMEKPTRSINGPSESQNAFQLMIFWPTYPLLPHLTLTHPRRHLRPTKRVQRLLLSTPPHLMIRMKKKVLVTATLTRKRKIREIRKKTKKLKKKAKNRKKRAKSKKRRTKSQKRQKEEGKGSPTRSSRILNFSICSRILNFSICSNYIVNHQLFMLSHFFLLSSCIIFNESK